MSRAKDPTELAATEPPAELAATATADPNAASSSERAAVGPDLERGTAIGKYTVLELLGEGGMGVVYAAYDPDLDRKVALKLLRRSQDQAGRARLLREAQAMARLTHPNVITVYEVGTVGDRDFIAMEFVDGHTVEDWLAAEEREPAAILEAFVQAGRGLAAAHRAGLVHRDFKPSNALVDGERRVRVTDFGLARRVGDDQVGAASHSSGDLSLTHTGAVLGTPAYMAPEQHEGSAADTRSDQFCFCVALYEALYGERPFVGDSFEALRENVLGGKLEPEPASSAVPAELRRILVRGLERDPTERYPSMEELLAELEHRPVPPSRKLLAAAVLAVLALVGVALLASGEREGVAGVVCGGGDEQLVGVWDQDARGRVRTAFAMAGTEGALGSYERLEVDLDEYASAWTDMYRDTCEDTHVRNEQSEEDLVLRMKCLQDRRGALAGLTAALEKVDPRRVDDAVEAVHELPHVGACGNLEALRQGVAPPAVAIRSDVDAALSALDEARSLGEVGRLEDAVTRAEALRDRAAELGYAPLTADVENVLGDLYWRDHRINDAEAAFTEAEIAAEEAGHDEARATALIGMTRLLATTSSRFDEAERYGRRARAAISRSPARKSELSVDLSLALVQIARNQGRPKDALAILDEISDSLRLSPLYEARLYESIGTLRMDGGDLDGARESVLRAVTIAERELGESHSETIELLGHLSVTERLLGNYDAADALEERLRRYWQSERGKAVLEQSQVEPPPATRSIEGVVVDGDGQPVSGARVVVGTVVEADGRRLQPLWSAHRELAYGVREARTDSRGRFAIDRVPDATVTVVAEDMARGRSQHVLLEEGAAGDFSRLVLRPTGRVEGRVRIGQKPAAGEFISVVPDPAVMPPPFGVLVATAADGSFEIERLAPGRYRLFVDRDSSVQSAALESTVVVVTPDGVATLELDLRGGDGSLEVRVRGVGGAVIPSAQIIVLPPGFRGTRGKDVNELASGGEPFSTAFWARGKPVEIGGLTPGRYSMCVVPLGGDFRNPEYMAELTPADIAETAVHCQQVEIAAGTSTAVVAEVPPMVAPRASGRSSATTE